MKNFLIIVLTGFLGMAVSAQNKWNFGVHLSTQGNAATFRGGMADANALFHTKRFHSLGLGITVRRNLGTHLSLQTGLNVSRIGFAYSLSQNYSLLDKRDRADRERQGTGMLSVPLDLIYRFRPNCKNVNWFVGLGGSLVAVRNIRSSDVTAGSEGQQTSNDYLNQDLSPQNNLAVNANLLFGVEKTFKKGNSLALTAKVNRGFTPLITSSVSYTVNGQVYNHTFTNYNNFTGLSLTYFIR